MISPYPDREQKRLTKMSAVAQYTDVLLRNIPESDMNQWNVTVFSEILDKKEEYTKKLNERHEITVERCYKVGRLPFPNLLRSIMTKRFDLVHIQHETFLFGGVISFFSFPFFVAALRLRSLVAVTLHHVVPQNQVNATFLEIYETAVPLGLIRIGFKIFYKMIGLTATELIVHEEYFKEVLAKDYGVNPDKVKVLAHGVSDPTMDVSLTRSELMKEFSIPDDATTVFGFFGYISKYKGLEYLISEFTEYLKEFPKSVLLITGALHPRFASDPTYQKFIEDLKNAAQSAGGRIIWFGPIDNAHVAHFYKLVDCLVLPYKQTTSASSVLSYAIGSETAFLVSESLKPTVRNGAITFGLYPHALEKKLGAFTNRNLHTESSAQIFVEELKKKRVWPIVSQKTANLYSQMMSAKVPKDVLIAGAYGQSNLGDEYMLDVCLRMFGRDRCIVASSNPSHTMHLHRVTSVSTHKPSWKGLKAFLECSTIVVGGGDQFKLIKKSAGRSRYALLAEMTVLSMISAVWRKKLQFLGVGIGNISTPLAQGLSKFCLSLADTVTLRDQGSFEKAVELTGRTDILLAADLTFLDVTGARAPLPNRQATLGIAPAFEVEHPELYAHFTEELGKAAQKILEDNPSTHIQFLPFQPAFHEHTDIRASHEILQYIRDAEKCSVDAKFSKDTIAETYRHMDTLWGIRLHSLIFACIHSVPFIALVYDEKVRRFLREIECEQWGIELDGSFSAEKLLALHSKLIEETPSVIRHLNKKKMEMRERAVLSERDAKEFPKNETHHFLNHPVMPIHSLPS